MSTQNPLDQATPTVGEAPPSAIRQALSIPNQLTMVRMLVLPFILIAMIYRQHDTALWLFVAAGLTDAVDGLVARRFNQKTRLGAFLDPMADKLLLSSAFVVQALIGVLPWWVTILVLSRDLIIMATVVVMILATPIRDFPPSIFGKVNTAVQFLTILAVVVHNAEQSWWSSEAVSVFIWATAATTLVSAAHYMVETMERIQEHSGESSDL